MTLSPTSLEPVYRAAFCLAAPGDADVLEEARGVALAWLRATTLELAGEPFDRAGSYDGAAYVVDAPHMRVVVVEPEELTGEPLAIRMHRQETTGTSVLDVGLRRAGERVRGFVRLARAGGPFEVAGAPAVAVRLCRDLEAHDGGLPLTDRPIPIVDRAGVDRLLGAILDPAREAPILIVTEPYILDASVIAAHTLGAAHVVTLSARMTFELTDALGKEWSVFGGAVRTYRPALDLARDDRARHPLMLAATVEAYRRTQEVEPLVTARLLRAGASGRTLDVDALLGEIRLAEESAAGPPTMATLAPILAAPPIVPVVPSLPSSSVVAVDGSERDASPATASEGDELLAARERIAWLVQRVTWLEQRNESFENDWMAAEERVERLTCELEEARTADASLAGGATEIADPGLRALVVTAAQLLHDAQSVAHDAAARGREFDDLKRRVHRAEHAGAGPGAAEPVAALDLPAKLDPENVRAWIARRFSGALVLTDRALDALDYVAFDDPPRVYRALALLGEEYRAMRLRSVDDGGPFHRFMAGLERERLEWSPAITDTALGRFERHYTVEVDGRRFTLDQHLKSMPRTAHKQRVLRVYFAWDEERAAVVLGPFPGHLPNMRT